MAKKARDILIAAGYTEAQINDPALATLLGSPQFCGALEAESLAAETAEAERARLQGELDGDLNWYQTQAAPALKKATADAIAAKSEAAAANAKLQAMQDYGLSEIAKQEGAKPGFAGAAPAAVIDPNTGQYMTKEQLDTELANRMGMVGDVVTMAADIPFDHRDLFGTPLPGGMAGLRKEFNAAQANNRFRGSLMDFWESKYKVADKRSEVAATTRQKELDDYAASKVAEERTRLTSEYGNPMTRPLATSRSPFTNRGSVIGAAGAAGGSNSGAPTEQKQPWDSGSPEQRSQNRITQFVKRSMEKAS
jgi:hypothetical protein